MEPGHIVTLALGVLTLIGVLATVWGTRGKTKSDAKSALDARIDARVNDELERVYARIDAVEKSAVRRTNAFVRILRTIAEQWPDQRGPNLDPVDIAEVEDTIPAQWLRRPAHSKTPPTQT